MTWKITGAPGTGDDLLYSQAGTPTLDLRFASSKSLNDNVSGQNLIDFTRGGNGVGTYVGSDGLIKNSVVNLLRSSEDISTADWIRERGTSSSSVITKPNGSTSSTPVVWSEDASPSTTHRIIPNTIIGTAASYTFSIFLKAKERTKARVSVWNGTVERGVDVDLSAGTLLNANNPTSSSITALANGWYRISVTATFSAATCFGIVYLANADGNIVYTGDGTSGIYLWGAQLEANTTTPGEYVKTTSSISGAPRFDHDPVTGESLGLLIEEQRTNLLTYSEEIENAAWSNTASSVTPNATTAPNGASAADKIVENLTNSAHGVYRYPTVTSNTTVTGSVFLKKAERQYIRVAIGDAYGANSALARINLDDATVSTATTGSKPPTSVSASLIPYPNGWYRAVITATLAGSSVNGLFAFNSTTSVWSSYVGDGTSGFFAFGAQLEAGSFPTSYIPTTTAAVTRNADLAQITGDNFSRWYSQSQGTVFADATNLATVPASDFQTIAASSDGTNNNRIELGFLTASAGNFTIRQGGSSSVDIFPVVSARRRIAAGAYSSNSAAVAFNGLTALEDTSVVLPTVNKFDIGGVNSTAIKEFNGTISRLAFFDRRLPNATLQAITA